jgi:hypothetical protein
MLNVVRRRTATRSRGCAVATTRHKCFLSYHHADQEAVDDFIETFDDERNVFIARGITMADDVIDSEDTDYVMSRIRTLYLKDSTVTIALIGECTWARKFVDWEVQASLRRPASGLPNGLLAILLDKKATSGKLPERVKANVDSEYATNHAYPPRASSLAAWIDDAFDARTQRASKIINKRERRKINSSC